MKESQAEMLDRVNQMASGSETWDLSDNDLEALRYVLSELRTVRGLSAQLDAACARLTRLDGFDMAAVLALDRYDLDKPSGTICAFSKGRFVSRAEVLALLDRTGTVRGVEVQ
jgi:hypothetical protein